MAEGVMRRYHRFATWSRARAAALRNARRTLATTTPGSCDHEQARRDVAYLERRMGARRAA
jgi:hypothetical protein